MPKNDPAGYLPSVTKARKGKVGRGVKAMTKGKRAPAPAGPAPAGFAQAAAMAKKGRGK